MTPVLSEKKQGVLQLTLNRPERANALSGEMVERLLREIKEGSGSDKISVITLTGTGSSFCAGADTSELKGEGPKRMIASYLALIETIVHLEKPFLVGLNGAAVGGGAGLAAIGDLVIASETAHFRTPELKLGLFPFIISPILIPIIGRKRFFEMVYTGKAVAAETALSWGLVNEIVPAARLAFRLEEFARGIASAPREAVARGKRAIMRGFGFPELGEELLALISKRPPPP